MLFIFTEQSSEHSEVLLHVTITVSVEGNRWCDFLQIITNGSMDIGICDNEIRLEGRDNFQIRLLMIAYEGIVLHFVLQIT
ncbi:hypothetical protein D3C73_1594360 [compost metagenome]